MKAIVFDFDEVIVRGSDAVKWSAWPAVFAKYDESRWRPLLEEAQARDGHGAGGDRYTMMEYIFQKLGEPEEKIGELKKEGARVFNQHVQEGVRKIGVLPEMRDLLARLSQKYPLYINTATPLEDFQETVDNLELRPYFKGVLGRPLSKVDNLKKIQDELHIQPAEILFFGDSPNDYKATKEFGCEFVGVVTDKNRWDIGGQEFSVIRDIWKYSFEQADRAGERMV